MIAVNQDKEGKQGTKIISKKNYEIWMKPLSDDAKAVILFNKTNSIKRVRFKRKVTGMHGKLKVRNLWQHTNSGSLKRTFSAKVAPHGIVMIKISKK